ncbi:MAG: hypothetical protein GY751_13570 [Bacteroidetes bacterium]|nr:hypothetical protein [Bacteroidota bacterium]
MENLYLKYLLLYEKYEDQNGPLFRTFIDNWYGFHEGGEMLSKGGRPKWFNNPDTHKIGPVLSSMHFVSQKARSVLSGQSNSRLVKDHAIPVVILRQMISSHDPKSIELVREFLLRNYRLGVITKEEDNDLNSKGLKSTMPTDWNGTNWKARYEFAGISGD